MDTNRLKELAGIEQLTESKLTAPSQVSKPLTPEVSKPHEGRSYGTTDGAPPEDYTSAQLSRLADALYAAQQAGIPPLRLWMLAPEKMRAEWNYAKWIYTP